MYTQGGVAAAGHLPLLLRDGRRVLPLRRADLRHEVRQLDLRRLPGEGGEQRDIWLLFERVSRSNLCS